MKPILIIISFFIINISTFAFTLSNSVAATFPENEVKVNVANFNCSNIGLSATRILELATISLDRFWNSAPSSRLKLERGSILSMASAFQTEGLCTGSSSSCTVNPNLIHTQDIIISCNQNTTTFPPSSTTLAVAAPNNISGQNKFSFLFDAPKAEFI